MGWIDTIRSLLGLDSGDRSGGRDVEVTVEREPAAAGERAVKEPVETASADAAGPATTQDEEGDAAVGETEPTGEPNDEAIAETASEADDTVEETVPEAKDEPEDAVGGTDAATEAESEATEAESEDAVDAADVIDEAGDEDTSDAVADTSTAAAETTDAEGAVEDEQTERPPGASDPLTDVKGIGAAYAQRLTEAGVEDVGALAEADAEELADATGISAKRIGRWIDRADARL